MSCDRRNRLTGGRKCRGASLTIGLLAAAGFLTIGEPLAAQGMAEASKMPGPLKEVRFDQNLGAELPLDAPFTDEKGRAVSLGDLFGERPVVLTFVYYDCPMLCSLVMNGVAKTLGVLEFDPGEQYDVVMISIDPKEGPGEAAEAELATLRRYGREGAEDGWHFLTGSEESIARVTSTAGFHFAYQPETDEYAHSSGIIVATPDGRLAQYYYGVEYPPKDVRLALVEASSGQIGNVIDQVLLYCFRYDPAMAKYTAVTMRIVRLAGGVFALAIIIFVGLTIWRERTRQRVPSTLGAVSR